MNNPSLADPDSEQAIESTAGEECVKLYRGIAVSTLNVERVISEIKEQGLLKADGMLWGSEMAAPTVIRELSEELIKNPLTIRDKISEMPTQHVICGCGDEFGATHYAVAHSCSVERPCGILISYSMKLSDLAIDGKDFLYTVFQLWDRNQSHHREIVRNVLEIIYGRSILTYFDSAADSDDTSERIGICHLACVDLDVVRAHHRNKLLINGRYGTRFCSAFQMQAPVLRRQIISVDRATTMPSAPMEGIDLISLLV